ncbi:hypothetical protein D3C72_2529310 [compost metagenome]
MKPCQCSVNKIGVSDFCTALALTAYSGRPSAAICVRIVVKMSMRSPLSKSGFRVGVCPLNKHA